jgi:hypothetical protein
VSSPSAVATALTRYDIGVSVASEAAAAKKADLAASSGGTLVGVQVGSAPRTVADKVADVKSVKDYGAKGDGSTDDSAAFQAAYDSTLANGTIFVPAGTYPPPTVTGTKFVRWLCEGQPTSGTIFNLPGIVEQTIATRKIVTNKQTTGSDYGTLEVRRETNHTGGTAGNVNAALRSYLSASSAVTDYEWSFVSVLENSATAGQNVAVYGQSKKMVGGAGPTWAGVFEARNDNQTAETGGGLVGVEVDVFANGSDTNTNRVGIDVVGGKAVGAGTKSTATHGIRIGPQNNDSTLAKWSNGVYLRGDFDNGINIPGNCATGAFVYAGTGVTGLNTTGATLSGGAVRMARGQSVEWEATATYKSYMDPSVLVIRFDNAGTEKVGLILGATPGVRVNGTQVVAARDTGWAAMTGTGSKATIAAAAAGTASAAYVQAELQGALNRIAALEARLKSYDAALVAHGLIGP